MLGGRREILDDEVQELIGADVVQRGAAQHRINAALANGLAQTVDDVLDRERALFEKLLHQRVVALGDHFDQRFVSLLRGFGEIGREWGLPCPCRRHRMV